MGIGKLAFLQFVDEAVGAGSGRERVVRGDYFVDERLGLGFVKPAHWFIRTFDDFAQLLSGQKASTASMQDDQELEEHLKTLVATISKYELVAGDTEGSGRFSPSITVHSNTEHRELVASDFSAAVWLGIQYFSEILRDYVILEEPSFQAVSMCPAARYTAQFVFEHRFVAPVLVRDKTLMIDQGHRVYTIHLYDSPTTGEAVGAEFDAFIGSLHLA